MSQEPPSGRIELEGRSWEWTSRPLPRREGDPSPLLEWWEFTFRLGEDPEQEAAVRAGVPRSGWSEATLEEVLRGARERTWRDSKGRLWHLKRTGWVSQVGGTARLARGEEEQVPVLSFQLQAGPEDDARRRPGSGLASLTAASDEALEELLEGRSGEDSSEVSGEDGDGR